MTSPDDRPSDREAQAEETYARLFGARDVSQVGDDPELLAILRGFIFGDVFHTGDLDDQTRELITVTLLACLNTQPQLAAHTGAALNVGVPPIAVREAVYQLAPFIGFPLTLSALATVNGVFSQRGITLPLPAAGTTEESDRYDAGLAIQEPLYGNEIRDNLAALPEPFDAAFPRYLTEFCFGDFYTRGGLTLAQRELLILCALTALGDTAPQLAPHARACLSVGHSTSTILAALLHCFPYVGFPRAIAAVRVVRDL